jgi:predicted Zn finger-like uncharacterized protein
MQTQCPHCDTRFRVTETQINTADGLVRCGVCQQVFNAYEVASQQDHQPSLLNNDHSDSHSPLVDAKTKQTDLHDAAEIDQQDTASENIKSQPDSEPVIFNDTQKTEESINDAFDFFDEDDDDALQHVVPEKFRDTHTPQSPSLTSTLLWSVGILLLTTTLAIEYVWFNRDQFNQIPELQIWMEKLCQQVECKNIAIRDPAKIELITRNIYSHPNEKNALMVNLTMKNNADFAQPYPTMQIEFSDIRGGTVAARRFLPSEYLPAEHLAIENKQSHLLQPGHSTSLSMEIQDPGNQAMTYEFNFL